MENNRSIRSRVAFAFLLTIIVFAACAVTAPQARAQKGRIKVATQTPLSGEQASIGEPIKLGAQLAVEEAVKRFKALGYDLVLVPYDDQAKPEVGVANARNILADSDVLLIVGHFNSGVALPSSDVYKEGMLAMVSPANTAVEITDRGYPNVNRVCGRDDIQGPLGAKFAAEDLKLKTVYIIQDKTPYGQGVASKFRDEAKKLGLQVLGFEGTEEKTNFGPLVIPLKAKNPDLIYFGGIFNQGGLLLRQMREKGVKGAFMGPDGIDDPELVKIAGSRANGAYYTSVAAPVGYNQESADFAKKYKQRFGKDTQSFAIYGYDAAAVGLKAIENAINEQGGKKPTRQQVSAAVRKIKDFKGVTGSITFDSKGDPVHAKYFVLRIEQGKYPGKVVKVLEQSSAPDKQS
jgi:branched-chain amino acid transport system substrate-binding protein